MNATASQAADDNYTTDFDKRQIALSHAHGKLEDAKAIYAWLIEGADTSAATPATEAPKKPAAKPKADKPAETKTDPAPVETPTSGAGFQILDYAKDVQPVVLKAGAANREATLALIKKLGAGHAKDVAAEKRAELVEGCNAILKEVAVG